MRFRHHVLLPRGSAGAFAECSSEAEVQHWMSYNIFLLLEVGTFSALVELLNMEIEYVCFLSLSLYGKWRRDLSRVNMMMMVD